MAEPLSGSIGIAGAGQLGLYLAEAAERYAMPFSVLAASSTDPAGLRYPDRILVQKTAAPNKDWVKAQGVICFENENLPWAELDSGPYFPKKEVMENTSDKLNQKFIFQAAGVPTAEFETVAGSIPQMKPPYFLKWAKGGYDGRGVARISHESDFASNEVKRFLQTAEKKQIRVYAEKAAKLVRELAYVAVATSEGILGYDLVETIQVNGVCIWVLPVEKSPENSRLQLAAQEIAGKIANQSGLRGVFAIEFFQIHDEEGTASLVVNELAPRVHNSGHWTMTGAHTNQFEAHIRCATQKKVAEGDLERRLDRPYCGMRNLVIPARQGEDIPPPQDLKQWSFPQTELFWYGKEEFFAGRKMGHLNFWAKDRSEGVQLQAQIEQKLTALGW